MSTCSASSLRPSASASFPHLSITILRSFPNKKWRQCNLLHCPVGLPFAWQQQIKSEQHRANRQKFTLLSLSISAAVDNNPDLPFPSFSLPKLQRLLPASGKQGLSVTVTDSQTCGFTTTTASNQTCVRCFWFFTFFSLIWSCCISSDFYVTKVGRFNSEWGNDHAHTVNGAGQRKLQLTSWTWPGFNPRTLLFDGQRNTAHLK